MSKENTSGVFKSRALGRAYALQALFQLELNPTSQVPNGKMKISTTNSLLNYLPPNPRRRLILLDFCLTA